MMLAPSECQWLDTDAVSPEACARLWRAVVGPAIADAIHGTDDCKPFDQHEAREFLMATVGPWADARAVAAACAGLDGDNLREAFMRPGAANSRGLEV
jgi:hypothetical protein